LVQQNNELILEMTDVIASFAESAIESIASIKQNRIAAGKFHRESAQ
jgi:hypothetical protein